jgi:hypothetical protein
VKGLNLKGECEEADTYNYSFKNTVEENEEEVKPNQTSDSLPSKKNTLEKRAEEIKPDQTSVPPPSKNNITPNRHVQGSKRECAAAPPAPDEDAIVAQVWAHYLAATGRDPILNTLTAARRKLGKIRLHECLLRTKGNCKKAETLMCLAIDALTRSDWHMGRDPKTHGKSYNDWERNIFQSYETMERLWN